MADKKGIFRSPGNIVFNAQSISERADQLRVSDDSIVVNYDKTGSTSTLQLSHTTANATISWNGTTLTASAPITGALSVTDAGGDGSLTYSGSTITYTGPSAAEVRAHFSGSTGITLSGGAISITNSGVSAATYGSATAVPQVAVNAQGQITSASDVNISIPHSQVNDFQSAVESDVEAYLSGGTGITYSAGAISITNTAVTPNTYGSATGVGTFTVNQQGQITSASTTAIAIPHSQITDFDAEVRALFAGTAGEITYNSSNGTFSLPSQITQATDFNTELTAPTVASSDNSTKVATTAWVSSNAPGTLTDVHGGTGITTTPGNITGAGSVSITNTGVTAASYGSATAIPTYTVNAQGQLTTAADVNIAIPASQVTDFSEAVDDRVNALIVDGDGITGTYNDGAGTYTIDVDNTVIRTTGNQSIGGTKTFTGTVDLTSTASTTASTQANADNSTKVATTAYVENAISNLQGGAPATLDTLNEIATALGNDAALNTTLTNSIATKAPLTRNLIAGAGLTGGGDLNSDRTFTIVGSGGITVNADDIAVDSTVLRTAGSGQSVTQKLTFTGTGNNPEIASGGKLTVGSSLLEENDLKFNSNGDIFFNAGTNFRDSIRYSANNLTIGASRSLLVDINKDNSGLASSGFAIGDLGSGSAETILTTTVNGGVGVNHLLLKDITNASYKATGATDDSSANTDVFGDGDNPDSVIYASNSEIYGVINGTSYPLTNRGVSGSIESTGASGTSVYGGSRTVGATTYHNFVKVAGGTGITVSESANVITFTNSDLGSSQNIVKTFTSDSGSFASGTNSDTLTIAGGTNITTGVTGSTLTINGPSDATTRALISATSPIAYNNGTGVISWSGDTDDVSEGSTNLYHTTARVRSAISVSGDLAYDSSTGVISFTNDQGDITEVIAGNGLQGGATSGAANLSVGGGSGISVGTTSVSVDSTVVRTSGAQTIAGVKTYSDGAIFNSSITGPGSVSLFDASGKLQASALSTRSTTDLAEGSNLYYTNARVRTEITGADLDMGGSKVLFGNMYSTEGNLPSATTYHGMFAHVHGTGKGYFAHGGNWIKLLDESSSSTTNLTEGTNLYYTNARVDTHLNVSSAGANEVLQWSGTDYQWASMSTGPQGPQGQKGDTGAQGPQGAVGPTGPQGPQGTQGTQGTQGATGDKGATGATGPTGPQGAQGPQGDKGAQGSQGTQGTQGTQGPQGPAGPTGPQGGQGDKGQKGEVGAQGPQGAQGAQGGQGDKGQKGATGGQGPQGVVGPTGPSGNPFPGGTFSGDITARNILATGPTGTYNIGSSTVKFGTMYANTFNGTATSAQYADLAENYKADANYEPGTVVRIGGNAEVTAVNEPGSYVVGVVSTNPAYLMNAELESEHVVSVALRGRVPCKVGGVVKKGDVLIASDTLGHGMVAVAPNKLSPLQIIGIALETKTEAAPGVIEILV